MGHTWKSKTQFQRLSHGRASHEGPKFERAVLPYVRLMFPSAVQSQARGSLDKAGVDIVVPGVEDGHFAGSDWRSERILSKRVRAS